MENRNLLKTRINAYWIGIIAILLLSGVLVSATWQPVLSAPLTQSDVSAAVAPDTLYKTLQASVVRLEITGQVHELDELPIPDGSLPDMGKVPSYGTGFVFDESGHIVTNHHVIDGADSIHVIFSDGSWYPAETVGMDVFSDLAILRVPGLDRDVTPLPLADGQELQPGHTVYAFGYPDNLEGSISRGVVSNIALGGQGLVGNYSIPDLIHTDVLIVPGHSGGPLLNDRGEVVGVNMGISRTAIGTRSWSSSIPVQLLKKVAPTLLEGQDYRYPLLGVRGGDLTIAQAQEMSQPQLNIGAYISGVIDDGAADQGGIQAGDILTALNETPIRNFADLATYLVLNHSPGEEIEIAALRDGKEITLQITLGERSIPVS